MYLRKQVCFIFSLCLVCVALLRVGYSSVPSFVCTHSPLRCDRYVPYRRVCQVSLIIGSGNHSGTASDTCKTEEERYA